MYVPVVVIVIAHDAAAVTGWLNVLSSAMGKKDNQECNNV